MAQIKPNYKPMSLEQAVSSRMTPEVWEAYLKFHEISITRRDDWNEPERSPHIEGTAGKG